MAGMGRRDFFKLGLSKMKDTARRQAPALIRKEISAKQIDLTILTDNAQRAEQLVDEMLREHFGETMLRLRQSKLEGLFPGGIVLFENNRMHDYHDDPGLFCAALRQVEGELHLTDYQHDPMLLRFSNVTPPFSRSVEIFHRDRLLMTLQLNEEGSYEFEGSLGWMEFLVENNRFSITRSVCEHRTCIAHPAIITPGQRISCLPNEVTAIVGATL